MSAVVELRTERVLLRDWRDADLPVFAALNADPQVMQHFPSVLSREQSDVMAGRIREFLSQNGWGLWAAESEGPLSGSPSAQFIGFVGLSRPRFEASFTRASSSVGATGFSRRRSPASDRRWDRPDTA